MELKKSRPVDQLTAKSAVTLAEADEAEIPGPPDQFHSDSDSETGDTQAGSFNLHALEEALSEININLEDILSNDSPKPLDKSLNPSTSKVAQKSSDNTGTWRVFTPLQLYLCLCVNNMLLT